ncbi:hypothetical protein L9F63_001091, partial [Diploptera punctata]
VGAGVRSFPIRSVLWDNKETTISQSARATPAHPAPTTSINTTPAAFTLIEGETPSHISFSVAALLADTRPSPRSRSSPSYLSQSPPLETSTPYQSEHPITSSDDELNDDEEVESAQGSVVDVEVLRDSNSPTPTSTPTPMTPPPSSGMQQGGRTSDMLSARFMLAGGHNPGAGMVTPVRPTPFSALAAAAAAYSAATAAIGPAAAAAFAAGLGGSPDYSTNCGPFGTSYPPFIIKLKIKINTWQEPSSSTSNQ